MRATPTACSTPTAICTRRGPNQAGIPRPGSVGVRRAVQAINAADTGNLQPLINFLEWLAAADDAEFRARAGGLGGRESLAPLRATQNLLVKRRRIWSSRARTTTCGTTSRAGSFLGAVLGSESGHADGGSGARTARQAGAETATGLRAAHRAGPPGGMPLGGNILKETLPWPRRPSKRSTSRRNWELYEAVFADGQRDRVARHHLDHRAADARAQCRRPRQAGETLRTWLTERGAALAGCAQAVAGGGR